MFFKGKKIKKSNECGEVMIEGMIVMIITMFMMVWILGIGFLYYQRYVTTIVTNDAATKIASTYNNPSSDIIMGYVATEDLSNRDLYRNFSSSSESSDLREVNEDRANCYVLYVLNKANFTGVVDDVDVKLNLVADSISRKHVELTVTCTYDTPFGEVLKYIGMDDMNKYRVSSSADCTDVADYISTISYGRAFGDGRLISDAGMISSFVSMINSFVGTYNSLHSS